MDTTDDAKTAQARAETYRRYILLHNERAHKATLYLHSVEERYEHLGALDQQELLSSCVRMLIDLSLKKRPAMDLAALFLRYVLLVPVHMRVPFVNAVASCCREDQAGLSDNAWMALRKKLHTLANKMSAVLYDLTIEFADWRLEDPAQLEMFKAPAAKAPQTLDDGGVVVDMTTGEVHDAQETTS